MKTRQEKRSEEAKKNILAAAGKLFTKYGFDSVTMRQIAKEAGYSHTAIYVYFKNKTSLLHELSMPFLQKFKRELEQIRDDTNHSSDEKLKQVSKAFIRFCLENRNMYTIFFEVKSARIDDPNPELDINRMRNTLFSMLSDFLQNCLHLSDENQLLTCSRMYFYMLRGIVGTYTHTSESVESVLNRLSSTFDEAFEVLLLGCRKKWNLSFPIQNTQGE